MQTSKNYIQHHPFPPEKVFPLLCPVREKDWLPGWDFTLIHSHSGLVEKDCVFTTPHHSEDDTTWVVYHHDPEKKEIGFVRHSPGKNVVRIFIKVMPSKMGSESHISYIYTPLSEKEVQYIEKDLDHDFNTSMLTWERSINHYLGNGEIISK